MIIFGLKTQIFKRSQVIDKPMILLTNLNASVNAIAVMFIENLI